MRRLLLLFPLAASLALAWLAVTSLATGSMIATWAPCPRNWGWGPAWMPRASPLVSHSFRVGPAHVKVCYGSPALRGRTMLGGEAVPFGKLWRTGANEPTTIHLDRTLKVGDLVLGAGSYSIYSIPGERDWTVIFNRSTRQWGLEAEYTEEIAGQETGRILARARPLDRQVERLTFSSEPSATAAVDLLLDWQQTRIRLPFDATFAAPLEDDVPLDPGPD